MLFVLKALTNVTLRFTVQIIGEIEQIREGLFNCCTILLSIVILNDGLIPLIVVNS